MTFWNIAYINQWGIHPLCRSIRVPYHHIPRVVVTVTPDDHSTRKV